MKRRMLAALTAAAVLPAFAQTGAPGHTQRDINQQRRIEQGLQSGQLATREAARLRAEQARIEKRESAALPDG